MRSGFCQGVFKQRQLLAPPHGACGRGGFSVVVAAASYAAWRGRQDCPHPALSQRARERRMRRLLAPPHGACGRGCAPVPNPIWGRGLSERSEFRSPNSWDRGKGTRRATHGRQWFWVLLPKQKDLVVRGRNPSKTPLLLSFPQVFSGNPVSQSLYLCFCLSSPTPIGDPVVGAASHAARRGPPSNGQRHEACPGL